MGIVVLLGRGEGGGVIRHWVSSSWCYSRCSPILGEDRSYSVLGCVGLEVERFVEVGLLKDRFADHLVSEFFECVLLLVLPVPWCRLFSEVEKGSGDL